MKIEEGFSSPRTEQMIGDGNGVEHEHMRSIDKSSSKILSVIDSKRR